MAGVVRILSLSRGCLLKQAFPLMTRRSNMSTQIAYKEMKQFWTRNRQLARPLSPHLSIYGYHLTMLMSISNRVLGVVMQVVLVGGSCIMMVLPMKFDTIVRKVRRWNIPSPIIYAAKYALAGPFVYHILASIRHLVWDTGMGYNAPTIIKGGYAILVATAILSSALVFGVKPSAL